jgi:hypothetical protein
MSWKNLSEAEKQYLHRMIILGEEAGKKLEKFARSLNKDAKKSLKLLNKLKGE